MVAMRPSRHGDPHDYPFPGLVLAEPGSGGSKIVRADSPRLPPCCGALGGTEPKLPFDPAKFANEETDRVQRKL